MSTHNGYIKEFPFIRIDSFTSIPNPSNNLHPLYYFLTHSHTDHLNGLNSPNFRGIIFMTPVTKTIVLNTVESSERVRWKEFGEGGKGKDRLNKKPKKKFENLFKVKPNNPGVRGSGSGSGSGIEQIREINYNQPIKLKGVNDGDWVKVIAIDANHCPGSCMYLFEGVVNGEFKSCLVTGDLRAEPWFLTGLLHNPLLAPYTSTTTTRPFKELDCIYLDTSNVLLDQELVTKEQAINDLLKMIKRYPRDTKFFLNCWTWGYEDLLKGIFKTFGHQTRIHLDWYKYKIYNSPSIRNSDPLLSTLGTTMESGEEEEGGIKFHACERYWKCDQVWKDGKGCYTWSQEYLNLRRPNSDSKKLVKPGSEEYLKKDGTIGIKSPGQQEEEEEGRIVYVNPVEMMKWKWEEYKTLTESKIDKAVRNKLGGDHEFPTNLLVPLARHSTLPELQRFVSIFKPKTLYPLTISTSDVRQPARDYLSMPSLFSNCLAEGGEERLSREAKEFVRNWNKLNRGVVVTSSPENAEDEEGEEAEGMRWLGEGAWEREMRKKGLNVEGGKEVVEEVLKWANNSESKPVVAQNGGVRDLEKDDEEQIEGRDVEPEQPIGNRKLTYGGNLSQTSTDSLLRPNLGPTTSSIDLLPSALPPPAQRPATPTNRPSHPSTLNSIGKTLRKSVTFAPSPTTTTTTTTTSTKSPELSIPTFASPTVFEIVPMKRTRSLPIPHQPSSTITTHKNKNSLEPISTSPSTSSSNSKTVSSRRRTDLENNPPPAPPPPCSPKLYSSPPILEPSSSKRQKLLLLPSIRTSEELKQERLVLTLQRTLQGKIGSDGKLIPFTEKEREILKRRERRLREETKRRDKGKGRETERDGDGNGDGDGVSGMMETSPPPGFLKQFETVGSSY
ncbi:hypothetical protein JCM3765_005301 [Sporobolomyces pararoseus]